MLNLGLTAYNGFALRVWPPPRPCTYGLNAYSHFDPPKDYILPTAKGIMAKTVTIDEIPKNELNEWGYPESPCWHKNRTAYTTDGWEFRGYIDGASRWMRASEDSEYEIEVEGEE